MELTSFHKDAICECMNIGIGKSASVLSSLVDKTIEFSVPRISIIKLDTIRKFLDEHKNNWSCCVVTEYTGDIDGEAILIFTRQSASRWVQVIGNAQFGDSSEIMPEMTSDLLIEVANIIVNGCIGNIDTLLESNCEIHLPTYIAQTGSEIFDDILESDKSTNFGLIINSNLVVENQDISLDLVVTMTENTVPYVIEKLTSMV